MLSCFHSRNHTLHCVVSFYWLALIIPLNARYLLIFFLSFHRYLTWPFLTDPVNVVLLLQLLSIDYELFLFLASTLSFSACLFLSENWWIQPLKLLLTCPYWTVILICSWLWIPHHQISRYSWVRWLSPYRLFFRIWWYFHTSLSLLSWLWPLLSLPFLEFMFSLLLSHFLK
jgi:hypothetical protein